jgi:hypothetical protein
MKPTALVFAFAAAASALTFTATVNAEPNPDFTTNDAPGETAAEGRGAVFELRPLSLMVPRGRFMNRPIAGLDGFGTGIAHQGGVGYYFTPNFGIMAGLRYSSGHQSQGDLPNAYSDGWTLQVPVTAQFSFGTRKRGLYVEAGLGLINVYTAKLDQGTVTYSNLADYKLGLGYRLPAVRSKGVSRANLTLFANLDFGRFTNVSTNGVAPAQAADGRIDDATMHYAFVVGVGGAFTP